MEAKIRKILSDRSAFLGHLNDDLNKNDALEAEVKKELDGLLNTKQNIASLSEYPEQVALIPLAKFLYIPGKIVHTGEYFVTNKGYPNSYSVLKTSGQVLAGLEAKVADHREALLKIEAARGQLEERRTVLIGDSSSDMPQEIRSERGVAVKVGEFYEILEFEE